MIAALPFNHRLAIAIFLTFTVGYFSSSFLLDWMEPQPPLPSLLFILFWALAVIVTLATVIVAAFAKPQGTGWNGIGERLSPLGSLAVALAITYALSAVLADAHRKEFARIHSAELAGTPPQAVIYSEGIPDGGTAIVRLPGRNPETLPQATMVRLTGERMHQALPTARRKRLVLHVRLSRLTNPANRHHPRAYVHVRIASTHHAARHR